MAAGSFMSGSQAALPTSALVRAVAFPHHAVQRKTTPDARGTAGRCVRLNTGNAVAESENIVAETAERIFADLADAQTVNNDKTGGWKAPLWQGLTDAGPA